MTRLPLKRLGPISAISHALPVPSEREIKPYRLDMEYRNNLLHSWEYMAVVAVMKAYFSLIIRSTAEL